MTEVPDDLLERSRARRRALGVAVDAADPEAGPSSSGGDDGSDGPPPTELTPIEPRPEEAEAPPPAYVTAARTRKKPPLWVGSLFVMLPIYLLVYVALLVIFTVFIGTFLIPS